jgi:hypothetical protein
MDTRLNVRWPSRSCRSARGGRRPAGALTRSGSPCFLNHPHIAAIYGLRMPTAPASMELTTARDCSTYRTRTDSHRRGAPIASRSRIADAAQRIGHHPIATSSPPMSRCARRTVNLVRPREGDGITGSMAPCLAVADDHDARDDAGLRCAARHGHYMSPEQARGCPRQARGYLGVGAVLFRC